MSSTFLPITKKEALERGWDQLDFVYIIGDAYVDHPSFGAAIISRLIESLGFSIGIISQPVSDRDYQEFGKPKYAFLVTGGNIDSDGCPLHRCQTQTQRRRLYPWRQGWQTS